MSTENNINESSFSKRSFLERNHSVGDISKFHKDLLGTDIPEGYFKNSKQRILDTVKEETPQKQKVIKLPPRYRYAIAASVILMLSLTIWLQNINGVSNDEFNELADDTLINSLFVNDLDLDTYTNDVLFSEVMVKAEISEQSIENSFINSLFVEDSLLDNYIKEDLLENIIL
ncbi:MAG: hypothetical protein JXQ93_06240 [Flavobacteriaceae bacterium]